MPLRLMGGRNPGRDRPAGWIVALALGMAVLVFVAAVAEIGLRLGARQASAAADPRCAGSDVAQASQKGLFVLDVGAGYLMRANACVRLRTAEYDEVLRTNSRGLAGPEVPANKPPGELRIVVLGDSYTVGGQVAYEQTFPAVLESDLRARGYERVRVINAGVGGYSTFNEAGLLRESLDWMQPDLVVVASFVGNDVAENVLAVAGGYVVDPNHPKGLTFGPAASALVQDSIGWFPRNQPVAPEVNTTPSRDVINGLKTIARQAADAARSDSLLLGALFGMPPDLSVSTAPGARPLSKDQRQLNLTSFEWTLLRDPPHSMWLDRAWPLFGEYLADIRTTSSLAPVLVMIIPQIAQVDAAERARTMAEYRFSEDEVDWSRPQSQLHAVADTAGLPVLDLLPAFQSASPREPIYWTVDQHFTRQGHRLTAELLADALIAHGWLRQCAPC